MKQLKLVTLGLLFTTVASFAQAQTASDQSSAAPATESKDSSDLSKGGLFVEPMLTYQSGTNEVSYPLINNTSDEKITGFGVGVKLGAHVYESVYVAADARYAMPKYDSSAAGVEVDSTAYNAGVTVGMQTPLYGIRVWGTYILAGELNPKAFGSGALEGLDVKFKDMKGYRVGAGIYVKSVSINLEYQDAKFDTTTVEGQGALGGDYTSVEGKDKSYIVSLSFPVSL